MDYHKETELIIAIAGSILTIGGTAKLVNRIVLLTNGIKTEGEILRIEKRLTNIRAFNYQYYPVIKYAALDHKWITKEYSTGTPFNFYKVGDKVVVFYDKVENSKFILNNFLTQLTSPAYILIGLCLLAVAARLLYLSGFL